MGFVVPMVSLFYSGVNSGMVLLVSWCLWFHGFIGLVVSLVSWFHGFPGVKGFMVS